MSGAEPFVVSRVRPSHLTPLSRRWLSRLLLRLLLHRYQCQLHQELAACDVFVITGDSLQHPAPVPLHPPDRLLDNSNRETFFFAVIRKFRDLACKRRTLLSRNAG